MTCTEIWTLVITGLGTIATFSAVLVALYQTRLANKKKLKLTFEYNTIILLDPPVLYVSMSVANTGNKDIILDSWRIVCKSKQHCQIMTDLADNSIEKALSVKLPYKLEPEERKTFYFKKDKFLELLKEKVENGELSEKDKVLFLVRDSIGKDYFVKSSKSIKYYLENEEED